ncbi:hypothetical protein P7L95_05830 [Bisgaard Taxon 10/6]|nr:hypothetical protein [Exercitatus varius]MDG2956277.1 hypothetical protein [Exercitatus varius]MDG2964342.1 hypothetical protein [Exercitatus varius]
MMNAMNYVNNPDAARHWRIRAGTADRDTSHAIAAMLAVKLQMSGKRADYQMPWNVPHSDDYDLRNCSTGRIASVNKRQVKVR